MNINSDVVRGARLKRGWTQQQLSEVSCLSLRTIQRVESQGLGSLETCNALCAVLELDRQQLINQTDNTTKLLTTQSPLVLAVAMLGGFTFGVLVTLAVL